MLLLAAAGAAVAVGALAGTGAGPPVLATAVVAGALLVADRRRQVSAEQALAGLAGLAPTSLFHADGQGRVVWANDPCHRLVGGVGSSWRDWVSEEDRARLPATVADRVELQVTVTSRDGRQRPVQLVVHPLAGGVGGALSDLTEVSVLQDALARREFEYELLATHSSDVVVRTDLDGLITDVSPTLARLLGHTSNGGVGSALSDLFVPEHAERIADVIRAATHDPHPVRASARLLVPTAEEAWFDVTVQPRPTNGGDPTQLDVSMRDVTDRRWAEEELVRREQLLQTVTGSSPVGIFSLEGSAWTFVNARLVEISGLSREDLLAGRLWEFVHPEDRLQLEVDRSTWTAEEAPESDGFVGGYYRLVRPDTEERWIHLRMAAVAGSSGHGWVGTVEDTTNEVTARQHTTLLATVVAGTTDLVAIMNPDGSVRFLNPAGREMMGVQRDDHREPLHAARLFGPAGWRRLCEVALPVATARGSWSGDAEIVTTNGTNRPVSLVVIAHRDAVGRIDRLSVMARDTSTQKAVERRLAKAATHDQLTGLPNRLHFNEQLTHALATASHSDSSVAVLFCDLDRFKAVNDTYGHAAGDHLLREVGIRLSGVLRSRDVAARVGGDEFLVLAPEVDGPTGALMLAERVREVLEVPVLLDGDERYEVRLSFSVGVALSLPDDGPKELIARADEAMYRAKALGKNRVQLHDPTDRRGGPTTLVAEQALRTAIEGGQLALRYQPIVDLRTGRPIGCEALVRWEHPDLGTLEPREFIDLAEETGLIRPLGDWVMAEAIRQAGQWANDLDMPPGLAMNLNLSAHQLVDGDLAERASAIMKAMRLPPSLLCVELTERALAADEAVARAELQAFRDLGAAVAVDDFGTGYSSLAQLRRFPVDVLKLDSGFVSGLGHDAADDAIVSTVQGLAYALGLRTVAEGVETAQQLEALIDLGCTAAQGFLFSPPLTPAGFEAFVRTGHIDLSVEPGPGVADLDVDGRRDVAEHSGASDQHPLHQ